MLKRLLSVMICTALILSVFVMPTSVFASDVTDYTVEDGIAFMMDCEEGELDILPTRMDGSSTQDILLTEHTEDNGNTYWELSPNPDRQNFNYSFMDNRAHASQYADMLFPGAVITFDLQCVTEGVPFWILVSRPAGSEYRGSANDTLSVGIIGDADGNWYTYKIEVGNYNGSSSFASNNSLYTVSRKLRDDADAEFEVLTGFATYSTFAWKEDLEGKDYTYINAYGSSPTNTVNCIHIGYLPYRVRNDNAGHTHATKHQFSLDDVNATTYYFDNFMVASTPDAVIANDAHFRANGEELSEIPEEGMAVPFFETRSTTIPAAAATAITAIYDKNDSMVSMQENTVSVKYGVGKIEGASVDVADIPEGGRVEAILWNSLDGMQPIAPVCVLGDVDVIEAATSENISTYANMVTVEGMADSEETVTMIAVDTANDEILAITQFKASADGSYKKTLALNPELLSDSSVVEIKVSGVGKTPDTTVVPMATNWSEMLEDFKNLDDDNALTFFEAYADNFDSYSDGDAVEDTLISSLTDEQKIMTGFLASTVDYAEDISCKTMIDELLGFGADVAEGKPEAFMAEFRAAKAANNPEAVSELIRTTEFVKFNLEGFFNLDDISKNLIASDAENIETAFDVFWNEYSELAVAQATKEQAIVPKFTSSSIRNGETLRSIFFEGRADTDNDGNEDISIRTILGITASYSDEDYDVMYTIYKHFGYEECDSFEKAYPAIVFLLNYVDEYKAWKKEIKDAATVTEEWNALLKIFGELQYVTPALADLYVSEENEPEVQSRLEDLEYEDLAEVGEDLSGSDAEDIKAEITAKLACIDDIQSAANDPYGTKGDKGYSGWVKKEVKEAVDNGWIEISGKLLSSSAVYEKMTEKTYRYLSDIAKYYEDAVDEYENEAAKPGTGGGSGGGGGGGSTANGSSGKVTTGAGASVESDPTSVVIGGDNIDETDINKDGHPVAPFVDVTAEFDWAKEQISLLREYGVLTGDGNGNFRPGANISREEFLAILLRVFDIEIKKGNTQFTDVQDDEWYADVVATAAELGIVKGFPDGRFGIGENVLRADMAVMIVRTMEIMGVEIATEEKGYIFTDYADIPDYAYNAVVELQQAGLVQGDEYRNYKPLDRLTRAESAVALGSIFKQLSNMHFYSWNSTLYSGNYAD